MLEMNAAKMLRSLLLELTDDPETIRNTVEGETNLHDAIHGALIGLGEDEILLEGLKVYIKTLQERLSRIDHRIDRRKEALQKAMELAELPKIEFPEGSISLRRVPEGLLVEDASKIPAQYWRQLEPVLDRTELKAHLKLGKSIEGARLDNGSTTISIRRR